MFAVIACNYLYSTHSVIRHSTCFNCHSWKNEKWKNEVIYVFITSFSSVPDSSMFFVQYKETLKSFDKQDISQIQYVVLLFSNLSQRNSP